MNNSADQNAALYFVQSSGFFFGTTEVSNNLGSLMALNSTITIIGYTIFSNSSPSATATAIYEEAGALTAIQSNIFIGGRCKMAHNHAGNGGAILGVESKVYVNGETIIANNTATINGGGIYLPQTE